MQLIMYHNKLPSFVLFVIPMVLRRTYKTINLIFIIDINGSTVMWWIKPFDDSRKALYKSEIHLCDVLQKFKE